MIYPDGYWPTPSDIQANHHEGNTTMNTQQKGPMVPEIIGDRLIAAIEKKAPVQDVEAHRALTWRSTKIAKGREGEFAELVTITPEIAERLLENNPGNRVVGKPLLRAMMADLVGRRWQTNGETIKVSVDGELNDGQHRLNAIVQSGVPMRSWVMFGLPRDSRLTVDMGKPRSPGDYLTMGGVKNANTAATVARTLLSYHLGRYDTGGGSANGIDPLTKSQVSDFYWKHHKTIDDVVQRCRNKNMLTRLGVAPVGAAMITLNSLSRAKAEEFFQRFNDGVSLPTGSPILWMRAHVMGWDTEKRMRSSEKLEIILRYWNAWRGGKSLRTRLRPVGSWPKITP